ncbi:MAG: sirohydrochlorin cobaltochelatase [Gemmataceae bacterium]|nr:sirohydrochlorin cobaltochelatase [Gemmataceae bacterium]
MVATRGGTTMDAILLIAHGSRLAEANDDLRRVAEMLRERGHPLVVAAYLELAEPGMVEGGRECVARGATRVAMAPWFLSAGTHVRRDLSAARDALAREFPAVAFVLAEPLGTHGKMVDVVEERVRAARG